MSYKFGTFSNNNLIGVHPNIVRVARIVEPVWNSQVIDGIRTREEQIKNLARGASKTMNSRHLPQADGLSHAIDFMPYPYNWVLIEKGMNALKKADYGMQIAEVYAFAGFVDGVAHALGIPFRSGYDWNTNRQFEDQSFHDLPHHELK